MGEYLGEKQQSEAIRLHFTLTEVPDGLPGTKPQVSIEKQGVSVLAAQDMVQGANSKEWYYNYTTAADATIGAYQIKYTAVVDAITFTDFDSYDVQIYSNDDIFAATGVSTGANAVVFNVKDTEASPSPIIGVQVSVHNSNNDDSPNFGIPLTDALGNTATVNLPDGTYKVRLTKPGHIVSEVKTVAVAASGTEDLTVDLLSISAPSNPEASTCYIAVYDLAGNLVTTGVTLSITKHADISKDDNGNFATNTPIVMTFDAGSGTWQAAVRKDAHVNITSTKVLGVDDNGALINRTFTVGTGSTTNLGAIYLS